MQKQQRANLNEFGELEKTQAKKAVHRAVTKFINTIIRVR